MSLGFDLQDQFSLTQPLSLFAVEFLPRWGRADVDLHVIGCCLAQETRVRNVLDDVAGNVWQVLPPGC